MHEDLIKACTDADRDWQDQVQLRSWAAVLRSNDIYTARDWLTARKLATFKPQTYGYTLVGYLDELAGVRSPCAATIGAWRFLLA